MKILNKRIYQDIKNGRPLRVNLGSGPIAKKGYYSLDILEMEGVDIVADINEPLDKFPDNSIIEIFSSHTFEHVTNLLNLMAELWRTVKPDGRIEIVVPHFSNPLGYSDPTHTRFFGLYTMHYFVSHKEQLKRKVCNYYTGIRFKIEPIHIRFARAGFDKWVGSLKECLVNLNDRTRACYERHFCWLCPADEIVYVLTPDK